MATNSDQMVVDKDNQKVATEEEKTKVVNKGEDVVNEVKKSELEKEEIKEMIIDADKKMGGKEKQIV